MIFWNIDQDLNLKTLKENDAQELFFLINDNRKYLRRYLNWLDSNTTVEDILKFIKQQGAESEKLNFPLALAIEYKNKLLGVTGFNSFSKENSSVEVGYWLDEKSQGQGIVTRCVQKLIEIAFKEKKIHRIEIRCVDTNLPSRKIIEKVGGKLEGIKRDSLWLYDHWENERFYSLLASDEI